MAAHEAHADRFADFGERRHGGLRKPSTNGPAGECPVETLQIPVVAALIGQIKRFAVRDRLDHVCPQASILIIAADSPKLVFVSPATGFDIVLVGIQNSELANTS